MKLGVVQFVVVWQFPSGSNARQQSPAPAPVHLIRPSVLQSA